MAAREQDWRELVAGQGLEARRLDQLELLGQELLRWNKRINLTGYRDMAGVAVGLFLDALALAPWIKGPRVLDIGSGAGFPGLVLALARPELAVTMLEARAKRVSFQRQAMRLLGLKNIRAAQGRAGEGGLAGERFDSVTMKALGGLELCLGLGRQYVAPGGLIVLPRGMSDAREALSRGLQVREYELPPPGGRRLLVVSRET